MKMFYYELLAAKPGRLETVRLTLPADLSFADWQAVGRVLAKAGSSLQWLIGDWWAFAEAENRFEERRPGPRSRNGPRRCCLASFVALLQFNLGAGVNVDFARLGLDDNRFVVLYAHLLPPSSLPKIVAGLRLS
jgi:hypothetical protein